MRWIYKIIILVFSVLFLTLLPIKSMLEPWGLTPKSQVDSETIEQAIQRIVDVHNDDPTAHLGGSRALEVHKTNSIIDHPKGSLVPDKLSLSDAVYQYQGASVDGWDIWGYVKPHWPGVSLQISHNIYSVSGMESDTIVFKHDNDIIPYDVFYQVAFKYISNGNYGKVGWGLGVTDRTPSGGFGFYLENNQLYCVVATDTHSAESSPVAVSSGVDYIARIEVSYADKAVYFFLDGVQIFSWAIPNETDGALGYPTFNLVRQNTVSTNNVFAFNYKGLVIGQKFAP